MILLKDLLPTITILYDNRCSSPHLRHGFGFSCLLEWGKHKILFDTGGDGHALFDNLKALNVSLDQITQVVFSHYHWDHTAAIDTILAGVQDKTPVYIPSQFSSKLENKIPKNIEIKKVSHFAQIDNGIYSLVMKGSFLFSTIYEQAILLKTEKGVVVVTGCAHPGIVGILEVAKEALGDIYLVLGGFHLHRSFSCTSAKIVQRFKELEVKKVAPCHCAGDRAISQFRKVYDTNFINVETGSIVAV